LDFSVPPIDLLDSACREHDFYYAHGYQKTGDLQLLDRLRDLEGQRERACYNVFKVKQFFSKDVPCFAKIVGADDLYLSTGLVNSGPYHLHTFVEIPVPQTIRDWLTVLVANMRLGV
jgi:hypothetical protein